MFNLKIIAKNKKEEKIIFKTELEKIDLNELDKVLDTITDKTSEFYITISVPQNENFITANYYDKDEVIDIIEFILLNIDFYKNLDFNGIENIHIEAFDQIFN
jgi:hypothetical protein